MPINNPNDKLTMVGLDGKVRKVPFYLKEELLKQGWAIITNAKQEYYSQYDRTLKGYDMSAPEFIEGDKDPNFLEVDKI